MASFDSTDNLTKNNFDSSTVARPLANEQATFRPECSHFPGSS